MVVVDKGDRNMNQYRRIADIQSLLSAHNLDVFVDSGTLLGFIRDASILSWDNDVDIAIISESDGDLDEVCEAFISEGYGVAHGLWGIMLTKKGMIETNIKIYRRIDDNIYTIYKSSDASLKILKRICEIVYTDNRSRTGVSIKEYFRFAIRRSAMLMPESVLMRVLKPRNYVSMIRKQLIEPTHEIPLSDHRFRVPSSPEQYLKEKYGIDWRVPKKDYSYKRDDGTISEYKMDLSDVLFVLGALRKTFRKYDANLYLSAGTLLGAVRDGGLIPWDYDIDLASKESCLTKADAIAAELSNQGLTVFLSKMTNVMAIYYKGITVDIDFYRYDGRDLVMPMKHINNRLGKLIYFVDWMFCFEPKSSVLKSLENKVSFALPRHAITTLTYRLPPRFKILILEALKKAAILSGNSRGVVKIPKDFVGDLCELSIFNDNWDIPERFNEYLSLYYGNWKIQDKNYQYFNGSGEIMSRTQVLGENWKHRI